MSSAGILRFCSATLAASGIFAGEAAALVRLNEGKDQIFLTLKTGVIYDSNIFAGANGSSDTIWNSNATAEYTRRAGIIGLDASVGVDVGVFEEFGTEDYVNPKTHVEFAKASGRTTGSLALDAARESRPDVAANVRAESWYYSGNLKARYNVIERYSVLGSLGYDRRDFLQNPALVDLSTYTAASDLLYAYTSQRDLFAGYRLRISDTARDTSYFDHALTAGISGRITPKINGTFRLGYQFRDEDGAMRNENHSGLTAAFTATWTVSQRASLTGQLTKDFATTSTDISNDSFAVQLDGRIAVSRKYVANAGIGYGRLDFLGTLGAGRNDTYMTFNAMLTRSITERLSAAVSYAYLNNWSTLAAADYDRHTVAASLSARF